MEKIEALPGAVTLQGAIIRDFMRAAKESGTFDGALQQIQQMELQLDVLLEQAEGALQELEEKDT